MKYLFLISLFFLSASFGCKSNPTAPSSGGSGVVMPLKLGNKWVYRIDSYTPNGYDSVHSPNFDTIEIIHKSFVTRGISDTVYFYSFDSLPLRFGQGYFSRNNGLWFYDDENDIIQSWMLVPFPMTLDSVFYFVHKDTISRQVSLINESKNITVPAGTFSCMQFRFDTYQGIQHKLVQRLDEYYALNKGFIYREDYSLPVGEDTLILSGKVTLLSISLK